MAFRTVLLAILLAIAPCAAFAAQPQVASTGLGQAWPATTDVSTSPYFHVYVFQQKGVRYIQVNDASGRVRGAIATAGAAVLALPIGVDADRVLVPGDVGSSASTGQTVYRDSQVSVNAALAARGTMTLMVKATCKPTDPPDVCATH